MKKNFSRPFRICAASCGILLLMSCSTALLSTLWEPVQTTAVFSQNESYAAFTPQVLDGTTKLPVENAVIVIPEENLRFTTDAQGKTDVIRIPYRTQESEILEKDWCEVSLLIYADGYAPYALFYLQLTESEIRQGPTILLFPDHGKVFSIIEGPPESWVNQALEKFSPP